MIPYKTTCRDCGRPILLVKTDRGKSLPVDREEVEFVIGDVAEPRRYVTRDGELMRGVPAAEKDLETDRITGWPCHFDTCPKRRK